MDRRVKSMQNKAENIARQRFHKDIVGGLRKRRLGAALKKPDTKEPDKDDLGGYDALQSMLNEKK